ncbi:MAG: DEAD/DEAH box helicase [Janthinobacterium lividum]
MTVSLYDHQTQMNKQCRELMRSGEKYVLMQGPTGIGKSRMAAAQIEASQAKGFKSIFIVPRIELVAQMSQTFNDFDIPHSFVAAGEAYNPYSKTHICTVGSLLNRLDKVQPHVVFVDETHYGAAALDKIIAYYKARGAFIVGLSATPWKLSGQGLDRWYGAMVRGPSVAWLIENKYLSDFRPFAFGTPNLSQIKTVAGDYAKGQLAELMEHDSALIGDAVKHYREHCIGRLNITFCTSRKHSEMVAQSFRDAGIPTMAIDGETPKHERRNIIRAFARRELLNLTSVDLMHTGFDLSSAAGMDVTVESMSDLRPTKSLSLQLQKWGRVLRKKDFPAMIFDHAGNFKVHGFPDDDREWSLAGREKASYDADAESAVLNKQCEVCHFAHRPKPVCPNCGNVYPIQSREVEERDGDLMEVDREAMRVAQVKEAEKKLAILINVAKSKGYKDPEVWAARKMTEEMAGRRATR